MNKKCFVPTCPNTGRNNPRKVFVHVNNILKRMWCRKLNIEFDSRRHYYCCEDHLNLEEDLENYQYWKIMKGRPKLKPTANLRLQMPCGSNTDSNIPTTTPGSSESSMHETSELQKLLLQDVPMKQGEHHSSTNIPRRLNVVDAAVQCKVKTGDKSVSCNRRTRREPVQATPTTLSILSSPTISTSPSVFGCTSETESSCVTVVNKEKVLRKLFLKLINANPQRYLGLPKGCMCILKDICEINKAKVKELDLIVTLFKIKQNDSMVRISNQFEIALSALPTIFRNGIEALTNVLQNLVFLPTQQEVKRNLPLVFKIRFSNVICIIDCFEIEIEKPSDPLRQSQTWSQYKNCNTLKYLIGCTPNGHIAFVSKGYGGRISDKAIVIESGFIDILPSNSVIMADRGFKEVETHLMTKGVKLLRPPSVYSGVKQTKAEVIQTKVIASLRVHVERVIRRVREFRLLKPHSVVNYKHVSYMNNIIVIACGLINLQKEIIKSE